MSGKAFGKFGPIVCQDAFNGKRKGFDEMQGKYGRRISAVFLKGFHIPPSVIFINGSVLEKLLTSSFVNKAGGRNKLNIDLYPLTGISHLRIRFWDIFGVTGFKRYRVLFT
jgi:hypothetical protein